MAHRYQGLEELNERANEWDSFWFSTKYTEKAYRMKIAYSDDGTEQVYRYDPRREKHYYDPEWTTFRIADYIFLA